MTNQGEISNRRAWLIVLIALLDDVAILVLVYVLLRLFGVEIPLPVAIAGGLLLGIAVFLIHRAVVPSLRRRKVTGAEGMIGQAGLVTHFLHPRGTVKISDEYWEATSQEGDIEVGDEVEVVGITGLVLEVRRKAP